MRNNKNYFRLSLLFFLAFLIWTALVSFADVQPIGPQGSSVGLATLNGGFHALTGVNFTLYTVTDWLGLVPLLTCLGFGSLGLWQWVKRKHIQSVDPSILILGGFYILVAAVFVFFEVVVVNFRPVLIEGVLEASYPSSTTLLTMCVMPTAMWQLRLRMRNTLFKRCTLAAIAAFTCFMVIGRLLSGVHWLTDIIGGALLSTSLVLLYCAFI